MNASTTIGLYDFLNMVVMGFLLFFPVVTFPTDAVFLIWLIPCFIVGLIYHKLMENTLGICMRNKKCMISNAYESVNGKENKKESSKENYYKAYYFLMKKKQLGNIPILEAQAAFLRNLLPIPIYYCFFDNSFLIIQKKWILWLMSIFAVFVLPFLWYQTQMKIHELVWEGKKYIEEDEQEKKEQNKPE